ncbi:MAG: serine/threonine protein kinase, partial [Acidobacteriota bacterium]
QLSPQNKELRKMSGICGTLSQMSANLTTKAGQWSLVNNWREPQLLLGQRPLDLSRSGFARELLMGQMLGHYRLIEQISSGGMGIVYRAQDAHLEREVAVKVLAPTRLSDAFACKRFHKEAIILSKLSHPNIIAVHDFDSQDGIDYLIMEYVTGQTLSARLHTGPLTQEEVVNIGSQIAAAVQEAHDENIIHRDLKPQNVILTPKGQVKVADFGLATIIFPVVGTAANSNVAHEREISGTLPYMPPEQLGGEPADFRSDIYSTGAVLYELATGQRPFPETQGPRLVDSILHEMPPSPSTLTHSVSGPFETIVMKCLQKEPAERYQSAAELRIDLQHLRTSTALMQSEMRTPARSFVPSGRQSRWAYRGKNHGGPPIRFSSGRSPS